MPGKGKNRRSLTLRERWSLVNRLLDRPDIQFTMPGALQNAPRQLSMFTLAPALNGETTGKNRVN